ncbi:GPW/gp25 family protein [Tunicatimonas pelagia]|uniref:GPW/gp25 family protein n=1 Tax=Tunicatimonas pelagia TaxID=931531 RepID=UPI002666E5E9|nr:GPW/gp25 family protein [Tunicatimonas pelagia]WKN41294.1 GPW/gp25 family protein [Tunicatimonas pelagia]
MRPYYQLPLNFTDLLQKKRLALCNLEDAIRQHIHLIIKTHYHEYRFDANYGCYVWDKDFDNIQSVSKWKDELEDLVLQSLNAYEKRLAKMQVAITIDEPEMLDPKTQQIIRHRKRITILVQGIIKKTNQAFHHTEYMFFSPLSLA